MGNLDTKILKEIKHAVLSVDSSAEMILFGSRARGDFKDDSDWDVLVLSDNEVNMAFKNRITDQLFYVGLEHTICISTIILNRDDWNGKFKNYPLRFEVDKDGVPI